MDDLALASRAVIRRLGRPMRLVIGDGQFVNLIGHLRGLRPAEIVGAYQESDVLVVLPAADLPAGVRPARLDRLEVDFTDRGTPLAWGDFTWGKEQRNSATCTVLSFIEHPRAVYAGARLVSFKGVARGQA